MKLTITGSKNARSYYVQKSIRKTGGKPTTVTIEKLGTEDEVRAKAGGRDPKEWAQEYVNELNRREKEQNHSIIVSYSQSKLIGKGNLFSYNCGYLFLQCILRDLKISKICDDISKRHDFKYDLNDILSKLIYTRIIYPSSKLNSFEQSKNFLEQPSFDIHEVYRALSVLADENDFIQSELYKNSTRVINRNGSILYYDCTNYFFEIEQEDGIKRYGKAKQHQPLPLVGMGLFMDSDGIPLAFDIFPGNQNEQPTLKPLEEKIIKDFELGSIVVCTDAGLSSTANRKFNNKSIGGKQVRSFITTQSIKKLPSDLKEFALDPNGWWIPGSKKTYNLEELNLEEHYDTVFYKDRWITEEGSEKKRKKGIKPFEQHLIVSFSFKYKQYQRRIREGQINRALKIISDGSKRRKSKTQNDPNRFIGSLDMTADGEACAKHVLYLDEQVIKNEEQYDGFYAVCTNMEDTDIHEIININRKRWEIEECFRIMKTEFKARPVYLRRDERIKAHFLTCFMALVVYRILEKKLGENFTCRKIIDTLKKMSMHKHPNKCGYSPSYIRTEITDRLHETVGFRTDYEVISDMNMKKIIRQSKKQSKNTISKLSK